MYQKLCVSMMVMLTLVVPGSIFAQTTPFTLTPVSAGTSFDENNGAALLNTKHVIKIKPGNSGVYVGKNSPRLVNTSGKSSPTPIAFSATTLAPEVIIGPYQQKAFYLKPNTEYSITLDTVWDTNQMFAGTYYAALKEIYYTTSTTTSPYDLMYALDFRTPVVAVMGEKAPYLTSITPVETSSVVQGGTITVQGQRLYGSKAFVVNYNNGTNGTPVQIAVASSTATMAQATVPTTLATGRYLFYLTNNYGQSNRYFVTVSSGSARNGITNVSVAGTTATSTWVQGVGKKINWATTGTVPTVDVLVCIEPSNCFFAYKNIANINVANNVRVGTNIPVGSKAYIKVRQAGTETVAGKSPSFTVVGTTTTSAVPVITLNSTSNSVTVGNGANDDIGTFIIKFDVKALNDTLYIPMKSSGYVYQVQKNGVTVATTSGVTTFINRTTSDISSLGNAIVEEEKKHTFELITSVALPKAGTAGQYRLVLSGVKWDTQDKATLTNTATVDFKTSYATLSGIDTASQVAGVTSGLQSIIDRLKGMFGF